MRIMLVEDDCVTGSAMAQELEEAGHEIVGVVATVQSAMELAGSQRPDISLIDIELGRGGSGIAAARGLRRHLGIPSIFVTADPERGRAAADAVLGIVAKPFAPGALRAAVAAVGILAVEGEPAGIADETAA